MARQPGGNGSAAAAGGGGGKKATLAAKGVEWYKTNVEYWDAQPPTDDGVLGGFGFVANVDIRDSAAFLQKVRRLITHPASSSGGQPPAVMSRGLGVAQHSPAVGLLQAARVGRRYAAGLLPPPAQLTTCWLLSRRRWGRS